MQNFGIVNCWISLLQVGINILPSITLTNWVRYAARIEVQKCDFKNFQSTAVLKESFQ